MMAVTPMASSIAFRRLRSSSSLAPLALVLLPVGCFNPPTASTIGDGSSTGDTSNGPTTMLDPLDTTGVDPSDTTGPGLDGTSSDGGSTGPGEESSSGEPAVGCGDGILDAATETCDDGNLESGDLCDGTCQVETLTLGYTGAPQPIELPTWVGQVTIEAWGAQGGGAPCCDAPDQDDGGLGGYATATVPVAPGATLTVFVGGQGVTAGAGGYNGGGDGGMWGAGGGGASDVRVGAPTLVNRVVVAGGGGGGNCGCPDHGEGGPGGGLVGGPGLGFEDLLPGGGGSQIAGGAAGDSGLPGLLGEGGDHPAGSPLHFAGGGGGYYGGGSAYASGAGGGSSYFGMAPDGATMPGMRAGDGEVTITPISLP